MAAEQALRTLSRDADPRVQGEAYGALAAADTTGRLDSFLLEGLASRDPMVRAAAAGGLGRNGSPAYLSALMQAYDRAQRDTINDERQQMRDLAKACDAASLKKGGRAKHSKASATIAAACDAALERRGLSTKASRYVLPMGAA